MTNIKVSMSIIITEDVGEHGLGGIETTIATRGFQTVNEAIAMLQKYQTN